MREDQLYKNKIKRFSKKIDVWHDKMTLKKQGTFDNDTDFISMGNSPSKFQSSDEEEELKFDF